MIKSELVQRIAEHNPHLYQRDVENIVNAILDEIVAALARGDRVELRGFGAFSVKHRPARAGRNPRTGAHVPVDQKSVPFFKALVVIPLGLIFIVFAVANRHFVTVSFDPFNSTDPAIAVSMPLFAVIIAVAILGVAAGGMATWFRQRHWRRAARQHEADARRARAETADLRAAAAVSRVEQQRLPAPSQYGIYGATGRDKQG